MEIDGLIGLSVKTPVMNDKIVGGFSASLLMSALPLKVLLPKSLS